MDFNIDFYLSLALYATFQPDDQRVDPPYIEWWKEAALVESTQSSRSWTLPRAGSQETVRRVRHQEYCGTIYASEGH